MDRRITKIKYSKGFVSIDWTQGEGNNDEYSIKCSEPPRQEFVSAMLGLNKYVAEMCELPENYAVRLTTQGVSFNYGGENETMGATITAQMKLLNSNAPLNLNTPNKTVEPYSESQPWSEKTCLSEECVDALAELESEANKYIDGQRAQARLFEEEKEAC